MLREKLESKFSLSGKYFQGLDEKSVLITDPLSLQHLNKEARSTGMSLSAILISDGDSSWRIQSQPLYRISHCCIPQQTSVQN